MYWLIQKKVLSSRRFNYSIFTKYLIYCLAIALLSTSCSNEVSTFTEVENSAQTMTKQDAKEKFAKILSKAVYNRQSVREFLKNEAIKQFDENYDVLYYLVKDEMIDGQSFRDILKTYSSEAEIQKIEKALPLLNILLPEMLIIDIKPEDLDVNDPAIPIAVANDSCANIYLNGSQEGIVESGQMPGFHLFVVNENSRVEIPSYSTRSGDKKCIVFKSSNYDRKKNVATRSVASSSTVGDKAIRAYNYFYKDDGSNEQMAYQRDYIYYGITPQNQTGRLNLSVREYLTNLEIQPSVFGIISDDTKGDEEAKNDPYIKQGQVGKRGGSGHSESKLIEIMWTKGSFNFKFEIIQGNATTPSVVLIPLRPHEIWDFNIEHYRKHGTLFRKEYNRYTIYPDRFASKNIDLAKFNASLPKWDITKEGLIRYINVYEEDVSANKEYIEEYEVTKGDTSNFNGGLKISLGPIKIDFGGNKNSNTITHQKTTIKVTRQEDSDYLGTVPVYFYDPIIIGKEGSNYKLHTYSTGSVNFSIVSK